MLTIKVTNLNNSYFHLVVEPINPETSEELEKLKNIRVQYDNVYVTFKNQGSGSSDYDAKGKRIFMYSIPLLSHFTLWWCHRESIFRYLYYIKKVLTEYEIPYKVIIDKFDARFELCNKKGKVYACYL